MTRIFTIGHSTRSLDDLILLLDIADVDLLVDIRGLPGSHKFPWFNKEALIKTLPIDIDYVHMPDLGGKRKMPKQPSPETAEWRNPSFRAYAEYMRSPSFERGISTLLWYAERYIPAIMCSEAVPWRCHRSLVTDALIARGVEVRDIMSKTQIREARMHDFAVVDGDQVSYP